MQMLGSGSEGPVQWPVRFWRVPVQLPGEVPEVPVQMFGAVAKEHAHR